MAELDLNWICYLQEQLLDLVEEFYATLLLQDDRAIDEVGDETPLTLSVSS